MGVRAANADDPGHDAADFGGGVELALALATFGGEVAHQVFVGITEDIVAIGAMIREVQISGLENTDQVGELFNLFFT